MLYLYCVTIDLGAGQTRLTHCVLVCHSVGMGTVCMLCVCCMELSPPPSRCCSTSCVRPAPNWIASAKHYIHPPVLSYSSSHEKCYMVGVINGDVHHSPSSSPPTTTGPGWQERQHPCRYHSGSGHHPSHELLILRGPGVKQLGLVHSVCPCSPACQRRKRVEHLYVL